jgi:hypothetical protein
MTRSRVLAYAAVWVVVVAGVAGLSWAVIARAAAEARLIGGGGAQVSAPPVTASAPSSPPVPSPPVPTPTTGAPSSLQPTASPTPHGATSAATTGRPSSARTTTTDGALTTAGGRIVASCSSGRPALKSVVPADGWRFSTEAKEDKLEVKLRSAADEIEITVTCESGVPRFKQS